jgi:hypothetical protein
MAVILLALRTGRCFTPQKQYFYASGTHFCQRLSEPQGLVRREGLGYLINIIHLFVVSNPNFYQTNNTIRHINTRQNGKLHVSPVRLSAIQRGMLYWSIRVYNNLPQNTQKMNDNAKIFKRTLKNFLTRNAFYSVDEYISAKHVKSVCGAMKPLVM